MKKSVLVLSMTVLLLIGNLSMILAQDQPKPKKDTVNMDTYAKPEVYYAVEDEKGGKKGAGKSSLPIILVIAGVVVVAVVAGVIVMKKKK